MPLLPPGSPITFTLSASGLSSLVTVDDVSKTFTTQKFDRKEYSDVYLLNLPEPDGSGPVFITNAVNKKIQVNWDCGDNSVRAVTPDDDNVANILQRFNITRYEIKGGPSSPTNVLALGPVALDHAKRLSVFDSYLDRFSLTLSYEYIYNLRSETFSYLTATGLSISGASITESNCLLRRFNEGVIYENPSTGTIVSRDWSATIDVMTISSETTL